jgi:hypothetical protein
MHVNRGLVFWGLALVTGGAVGLALQLGYVDRGALAGAWRLWPLVLVAIGLAIILSRTRLALLGTIAAALVIGLAVGAVIGVGPSNFACGGSEPAEVIEQQHETFSGPAEVTLRFDCGTLEVNTSEREAWRVATADIGRTANITASETSLAVSQGSGEWWNISRQHWVVALPSKTTNRLEVDANAADTTLDLSGGLFERLVLHPNAGSLKAVLNQTIVEDLDLELNAGSVSIVIGRETSMTGTVHVNAGSIQLCAAPSAVLHITVHSNVTFSHNLDDSGLRRYGDTWSSADDGPGADLSSATLTIEGNAGNFTLNPEGGCG